MKLNNYVKMCLCFFVLSLYLIVLMQWAHIIIFKQQGNQNFKFMKFHQTFKNTESNQI